MVTNVHNGMVSVSKTNSGAGVPFGQEDAGQSLIFGLVILDDIWFTNVSDSSPLGDHSQVSWREIKSGLRCAYKQCTVC